MVEFLQHTGGLGRERPFGLWIAGSLLGVDLGFAVTIHHHFDPPLFQSFCKMSDEEFGASVSGGGNRYEGRSDESYTHMKHLVVRFQSLQAYMNSGPESRLP